MGVVAPQLIRNAFPRHPPSISLSAAFAPISPPARVPVHVRSFKNPLSHSSPRTPYKTTLKVHPFPLVPPSRLIGVVMASSGPVQKSEEEWQAILSPEQFRILRLKGTEEQSQAQQGSWLQLKPLAQSNQGRLAVAAAAATLRHFLTAFSLTCGGGGSGGIYAVRSRLCSDSFAADESQGAGSGFGSGEDGMKLWNPGARGSSCRVQGVHLEKLHRDAEGESARDGRPACARCPILGSPHEWKGKGGKITLFLVLTSPLM
ncbi:hypothetical protein B296_00036138 [Ensete ventricosum]|uniref:MsrB domain-containing protein n=1 Tax=Ensete ventricosum TaxID=4639 RepID=A0A427A3K1_ENSVE|nr:hypothetical protein B296_00036138 [Ensete ventricosum]